MILLTGGVGLIGSRILELNRDFHISAPSKEELDITEPRSVEDCFRKYKPEVLIHLAALTDTEKAESNRPLAKLINVTGTQNLVNMAEKSQTRVIFFSTDYISDGQKDNYSEQDPPKPLNYYGQTKLEGEKFVQKMKAPWLIIRTSYPYRAKYSDKSDCVRWMLPKLSKGESVNLVRDQKITPTFVDDLAQVLFVLLNKQISGVYHVAGSQCLSFWEMGQVICEVWGFDKSLIKSISLEEFRKISGKKVVSPRNSCLVSSKLKREFGLELSDFKSGLIKLKAQLEAS